MSSPAATAPWLIATSAKGISAAMSLRFVLNVLLLSLSISAGARPSPVATPTAVRQLACQRLVLAIWWAPRGGLYAAQQNGCWRCCAGNNVGPISLYI